MSAFFGQIKRWIVKATTDRLGLKLVAAVTALLLVTLVRFQEETERFFDVEIVPIMPEPESGLKMTGGFPKTVRVRLAGPSSVINAMSPSDIPAVEVDLRGRHAGISHYYFSSEVIEESLKHRAKKMQFVRVVRTSPESVQLKMEKLVSREVPVKINTEGKPVEGAELLGSPAVEPAYVTLEGPSSSMRGIKSVETDSVIVDGMGVGAHDRIVSAVPIDGVSIRGADALRVTLKVRWIPGERLLKGLAIALESGDMEASLKPKKVNVKLSGPKVKLDALDVSQIQPVLALEKEKMQTPGTVTGDVTISWLPDGIKVVSVEPPSVRVSLSPPATGKAKKKSKKSE